MHKFYFRFLVCFFVITFFSALKSQVNSFSISGKLLAADNKQIVGAKIKSNNSLEVVYSNENGEFNFLLPQGNHTIRFEAENYANKIVEINLNQNKELGNILLINNVITLDEVVFKPTKKDQIKIEAGKKTYTIGNESSVKGNSLIEVLQNVPSVNIDAEGNVSLRGNENAQVLIDGKPSSLTGITNLADALKKIPANLVDKIEVITNPSAAYDAAGSGGVINIILKKSNKPGLFGAIETFVGNQGNVGANLNLNYKKGKWSYFTNLAYQHSEPFGTTKVENKFYLNNALDFTQLQEGKRLRVNDNFIFQLGTDYSLNELNTFSVSGILKNNFIDNISDINFLTYNNLNQLDKVTNRRLDGTQKDFLAEGNLGYIKRFKTDKQLLTVDFSMAYSTEEGDNIIVDKATFPTLVLDTSSINPRTQNKTRYLLQSNYYFPVKENGKIEVGYRGNLNFVNTDLRNDIFNFSTQTTANDSFFTLFTKYSENIQAFYAQFSNKINKYSYQFGLRTELSELTFESDTTLENRYNFNDIFPSGSINYELSSKTNLSFAYSRRIDRPNVRFLNPVNSAADNNNIFSGNITLKPSYTNSFEAEIINNFKKVNLSTAIYFSNTPNSIAIIRTFDAANDIFIAKPINIDFSNRYGLDFNLKYSPLNWLKISSNLNLFYYNQQGNYFGISANGKGFSSFGRLSSNIILPQKINFSTVLVYNGPNVTENLNAKSIYFLNLGISKDIFKEKATLALNVNDLFNTSRRRFTNFGADFTSDANLQARTRQINLSFTYRFNNTKKEQ
ncbi:MAG: outer membrane beta-barrel protein, partial [Solirubrobacteraceae bacterium]